MHFNFIPSSAPIFAAAQDAASLFSETGSLSVLAFITNSCLVAALVLGLILWLAKKATRNMQLVPHKAQNAFEAVVEFLYGQVEAIVGPKVAPRAFPLLASLFIFILISNWFGLVPGVGTLGWGHGHGAFALTHVDRPLFRPATADLNMTLGMALCFMIIWFAITIREVGLGGFLKHMFGSKGGLKGLMGVVVAFIFAFVGLIEVVSIVFRPVSLALRLFGNVFAGETLLHTMMNVVNGAHPVIDFLASVIIPIPFYFMEILVGLLQAIVFTLLCAVYTQLSTESHDEDHGHEGGHH